jgi:hypothetical protein
MRNDARLCRESSSHRIRPNRRREATIIVAGSSAMDRETAWTAL